MKKIKLFTLALAAILAGSVMAEKPANISVPAEVLTLPNVSSDGWAGKVTTPYFILSEDTLVMHAYNAYSSVDNQNWMSVTTGGSSERSWEKVYPFQGSAEYGIVDKSRCAATNMEQVYSYRVKNCVAAMAYVKSGSNGKRTVYLDAYEYTQDGMAAVAEVSASMESNTAGAIKIENLDAAKEYVIVIYNNSTGSKGSSNGKSDVYEVAFVAAPIAADNATLKSITINGEVLKGFDPATETYNVELPFGTTTVPTVAAVATSKKANAVVTPATSIPGATTILVTAEDATTTKTYTINFTAAQTASSEKELLNVTVGGKAVVISENAGSLLVSKSADLTALVVNFEVSESATASIESGSTQNFTTPLAIVVTAQDKSTATYTITVTKAVKDVLYLTAASTEGDKMYAVVAAKGFYVDARKNGTNTDFSGYDLVVLHESLTGKDAASGELSALATANVPVLNTKSYFYPEGRWGWGVAANGNDQQGVRVNAKYTNIASHPLFAGLNDSITIYNTKTNKNIQPVVSFTEGKEGYVLANVAGGAAIHELPAAARVGAEGTAKYLLISLLNGQYADLTAEAETLLSNAVDYLMSAEAWVPQSGPSTAVDNAVVAEKAQKMIINGQLVIVKDGVRYNAQGVQL